MAAAGRVEVVDPVAGGTRGTRRTVRRGPQGSGAAEAYGAGERVGAADWLELLGAAVELSVSSATSM
jgi:hypothetical protein